jgi:hypothetical protein
MALRRSREGSEDVLFVDFNQDASCISVGARNGYRIYNCHPFGAAHVSTDGGIGIAEMLECTSLVALVGGGQRPAISPRQLQIYNTKTGSAICELNFVSAILAVRLNRKRAVVVLATQVQVFELDTMKIIQTLETAPNPTGLCALSPNDANCHVAFGTSSQGEVVLYDALHLTTLNALPAHSSAPAALAFDATGTRLATASVKGTVIRIFAVPSGEKLHTLRRGSYPSAIYSLGFSPDASLLCASSAGGTVHIFKIGADSVEAAGGGGGGGGGAGAGGQQQQQQQQQKQKRRRSLSGGDAESGGAGDSCCGGGGEGGKGGGGREGAAVAATAAAGAGEAAAASCEGGSAGGGDDGAAAANTWAGWAGAKLGGLDLGGTAGYLAASVTAGASAVAGAAVGMAEAYVPASVFDVVSARSFACARLRCAGVPNLCSLRRSAAGGAGQEGGDTYTLQVVTIDGTFYEYACGAEGGDCRLQSENVLRDVRSEEIAAHFVEPPSGSS